MFGSECSELRKIILLGAFALSIFCPGIDAVSAYPKLVRFQCPDGTFVNLQLKGDEFCKWAVTEDGYTLLRDKEGDRCYAAKDSIGTGFRLETVCQAFGEIICFFASNTERIENTAGF